MTLRIGSNNEVIQVFPGGGSGRIVSGTTADQVFAFVNTGTKVVSINAAVRAYIAFGTSTVATNVVAAVATNTLIIAAGESFTLAVGQGITHYAVKLPTGTGDVIVREGALL